MKRIPSAALVIVAACFATKTLDSVVYIMGHATIKITNPGSCAAHLASLLLILEQNVGENTGNSYGNGGWNAKAWSIAGTENAQIVALCGTPPNGIAKARICENPKKGTLCDTPVPYWQNTLFTDVYARTPFDLSTVLPVPAGATCESATVITVEVVFPVARAVYEQQMLPAGGNNYYIKDLTTFLGIHCSIH